MLSDDAVVRLNERLAGRNVLSVYLNAEETDPAVRRAWRVRLNAMMKELEEAVAANGEAERRALGAAAKHIEAELERHDGLLPGRGWVAFASPEQLWHAGETPAPMPDLVRWEAGAHVSPYVRAMKQARPVTVIVADREHARLLAYAYGELREEDVLRSLAAVPDSWQGGTSKRASTSTGVRGEPRGDAVRRAKDESTHRMINELMERISPRFDAGHLFVVAGPSESTAAIIGVFPDRVRDRAIEVSSLRVDAPLSEVKQAVEEAASALSARLHAALVDEVIDTTRSAGRACLGLEHTERALEAGAVDTLLVSRAFARADPDRAERLVDRTFLQGGSVEEIGGEAGERLDGEGGIGARLRYLI